MNFNLIILLFAITSLINLNNCISMLNCIEGNGNIIKQERLLEPFDKIVLNSTGDIYIKYGNVQHIAIETNENIISLCETKVIGKTLNIGSKKSICPEKLNLYITIPSLEGVKIKGSGSIISEDKFSGDQMLIEIDGSGNIKLNPDVNKLKCEINGSGDMKIKGKSNNLHCEINGSGDINLSDLESKTATVEIYGSGDCQLLVTDKLKAVIYGSGDIVYKGTPSEVSENVYGSGSVRKIK